MSPEARVHNTLPDQETAYRPAFKPPKQLVAANEKGREMIPAPDFVA
jgi:hypothetical protein